MNLSLCPLLPVTVGLIAGILLHDTGAGWWGLAIATAAAATAIVLRRHRAAMTALGAVAGIIAAMAGAPHTPHACFDSLTRLYSGTVTERRLTDGSQTLIVRIDSCGSGACRPFSAHLFVPATIPQCAPAHRIAFSSTLHPLTDTRDLPDQTDYITPLRRRGVTAMSTLSPDSIKRLHPTPGVKAKASQMRSDIAHILAYSDLSPETSAFLTASLTGERDLLSPHTAELFSSSGLAHILALSGLHVGILMLVVSLPLLPLVIAGHRKGAMLITIALLWGFALLTGLGPSVTRATLMASVILATHMLERETAPLNSLCLAAIIILILSPLTIHSIGFQLSFLAVAGIMAFHPALMRWSPAHPAAAVIWSYAAVTLSALAATGIIAAHYFGYFPLWSVVANLPASFLLPPLLGGGVLLIILGCCGAACAPLASMLDTLYTALEGVASWTQTLPGAVIHTTTLTPLTTLSIAGTTALTAIWAVTRRHSWLIAASMALTFTLATPALNPPSPHPEAALYLTRSSTETTLLIRQGKSMTALTTARPSMHPSLRSEAEHRYATYMIRRGVDSIPFRSLGRGSDIRFHNSRIIILTSASLHLPSASMPVQYLVMCAGFRGDPVEAATALNPDSVILSTDLHPRLRQKYLDRLAAAGIPARSLRDAPLAVKKW